MKKPYLEEGNIVEKAWQIDMDRINEGYLYDEKVCWADTINGAKKTFLSSIKYEDLFHAETDRPITYLNIPVIRKPEDDLVVFEGVAVIKSKIPGILDERKRMADLDEIAENPHIKFCYIVKRGLFYAPNWNGYTGHVTEAGVYDKMEAYSHARTCDKLTLRRIDKDEHNNLINDKIRDLQTRLIP